MNLCTSKLRKTRFYTVAKQARHTLESLAPRRDTVCSSFIHTEQYTTSRTLFDRGTTACSSASLAGVTPTGVALKLAYSYLGAQRVAR